MSNSTIDEIERQYDALERQFPLESGNEELEEATQFVTNDNRPIHRWFHFKEGFAADILEVLDVDCESLKDENTVFIDPFCGSGTSLLAGDLRHKWRAKRIGFEVNPFLHFVISTKVNWRQYNPHRLSKLKSQLLAEPLSEDIPSNEWPSLSTFHNPDMFAPKKLSALLDAKRKAVAMEAPERDLLLLGIAASAEEVGFYRKDGRALRILRSQSELQRRKSLSVASVLRQKLSSFEIDLRQIKNQINHRVGRCEVVLGDGRSMDLPKDIMSEEDNIGLIAYSPPYFNHIDYTEVYKIELWLLDFVEKQSEMLSQRKKTLRSHASVKFTSEGENLPDNVWALVDLAATEIEATGKKWHKRFRDTAYGYLEDMNQSLSRQYEILQPGGQVICIVANSAHGSGDHRVPIASDLFIASIARNIGFEVKKLLVARQMRRRDHLNRYLRETILILAKPT